MRRDESVYLQHVLDAIARAEEYLQGVDDATFYATPLLQDGVIRQMEIIGEAVRRLSDHLRARHPDTPWHDIAAMRDKLIHDYFGVDLETVWLTARDDLPRLKSDVSRILKEL
jgi:uncharacterized protein with HEPN domain